MAGKPLAQLEGNRTMSKQVIYLSHDELTEALRLCYRAEMMATAAGSFVKMPAIIWGDPGIGKTSVARALSKDLSKNFTDQKIKSGFWSISLAIKDVVDLGGHPVPDHENKKMIYFPPGDMPFVNGYVKNPDVPYGVLVLDDIDRAPTDVRNGAMCLLLDRILNGNVVSPNVYVCGTANGESDAGSTSPLGGACGNRVCHLYLRPQKGWSRFLSNKSIESVEDILPIEQTNFRAVAMCTPRSIEMAKWLILARRDETPHVLNATISGCVGISAGQILSKMATRNFSLDDILNGVHVDSDHVTFDDMGLLQKELEKLDNSVRPSAKLILERWAATLNPEFRNIVTSLIVRW